MHSLPAVDFPLLSRHHGMSEKNHTPVEPTDDVPGVLGVSLEVQTKGVLWRDELEELLSELTVFHLTFEREMSTEVLFKVLLLIRQTIQESEPIEIELIDLRDQIQGTKFSSSPLHFLFVFPTQGRDIVRIVPTDVTTWEGNEIGEVLSEMR
jgi:hypothetical protein